MIRIDLTAGTCDMLVEEGEIARRRLDGVPAMPADQTPWQRIYRAEVNQLSDGAVMRSAEGFHRISVKPPRHNH